MQTSIQINIKLHSQDFVDNLVLVQKRGRVKGLKALKAKKLKNTNRAGAQGQKSSTSKA